MVNRMVLILVCFASIFGLCMFQVQAADVDTNNKVVSVHLYVLFTSDEGGEFPLEQTVVLEGKDFRIYSFRQTDAVNGTFSSGCYAFSPKPFYVERYGVRSLFDTPFEVDGNVIYYCSIGGWSSSAKDEQYTNLSGFQNLNYCSGSPSDNAKKIAEEMARAGYYDYDDSKWVTDKEPSYDPGKLHFSSSLGYLQKVQYRNLTPTDVFPYQIYSQITWDTSNEKFKNAYVQFAADVTYKVGSKIFSESMVIFNSYSIPYSDGEYTFLMSDVSRGITKGSDATVKKVDYYYVRLVKYDKDSSSFLYGGWTRIDTNKFTIDTIAYDEENQDYYIDTDSDDSYSDQMGIDGSYGGATWGDLASASVDSFKWFFSMLKDLFDMMGSFPSMLKTVFSFLPSAYINCLSLLLMACIIMRILGR